MIAFKTILQELGQTKLIAVSKTRSKDEIMLLYQQGQRLFGENKVQEMLDKQEVLPNDIEWHLIGHLQRNKVKYIASFVSMIHSVDSKDLLYEIAKQAAKYKRRIPVLLQLHIAEEESKFGLDLKSLIEVLEYYNADTTLRTHIKIAGLMGMATNTEDEHKIRSEFQSLRNKFIYVQQTYLKGDPDFCELSMGMSSDYKIAIEEGSTMVRIGSLLFGERDYSKT